MDAHVIVGMDTCACVTGSEEDTQCPAPSLFASFPGDLKLAQRALDPSVANCSPFAELRL